MSKSPLSLPTRLARLTGIDVAIVAKTLAEPHPGSAIGDCWLWRGAVTGNTPVMLWQGKTVSVRQVIFGFPGARIELGCVNYLCVNPNHARVLELPPAPEPAFDPLDELIADVLSCDDPFEELDYPRADIERALAAIKERNL